MRFNDGFWLLKSGVKAYFGLEVVQPIQDREGFHLQVSTKPIRHRGDTLAGQRFLKLGGICIVQRFNISD